MTSLRPLPDLHPEVVRTVVDLVDAAIPCIGGDVSLKRIGSAAEFFLTRYWQRTVIGPYVLTTVETRPGVFETTVNWGDDGPEVDAFGSGRSFDKASAEENHEEVEEAITNRVGKCARIVIDFPPPAA